MEKCIVCKWPLIDISSLGNDVYRCDCYSCGKYSITLEAKTDFDTFFDTKVKRANLSGYIHNNQEENLTQERLAGLAKLISPSVDEKAARILIYLSKIYPIPGQQLPDILSELKAMQAECIDGGFLTNRIEKAKMLLPLYSIASASSYDEMEYLLYSYLFIGQKYLDLKSIEKITPLGWSFIERYKAKDLYSNIVFIAMKFEEKLKGFSEKWVESAIRESGYVPIRIDKYEHNNLIDDEIIANIRRSRFLVADLTGNSCGVYFEAGFAKGLDLPVIYLCNVEHFNAEEKKVHFDTNHYSFILWDENFGEDLKCRLKNRIAATIGLGENR